VEHGRLLCIPNTGSFFDRKEKLLALSSGRKKPRGTLHALLCAKDAALDAPFTVINADDYYGRKAYETMAAYLSNVSCDAKEYAMVGYVLKNTMSKSGTVTRGVCKARNGYLVSMEEQKNIGYKDNGGIYSIIDDRQITLTGNEWVSMNFFGFTLSALPCFQDFFDKFILKNAGSEKAEALLPDAANGLVKDGEGKIRGVTSGESWFGMTYPEDKAIVKGEISRKIKDGYYPEKLWEKD
jgi:hypothetical protein